MQDEKIWSRRLAAYKNPSNRRAIFECIVTLLPFIILWAAMWGALSIGYWLTLILAVPTAFMLVRLFAIQHDCGHGAMFTSRAANDWVGRFLGVLTVTPYDDWRRSHALHHAGSGNLERRGIGDINTLTVAEYEALSKGERWTYWLYRHPVTLFVIGPAYQFLLRQRLPNGHTKSRMPLYSSLFTNSGLALLCLGLIWLIGWKAFLMVHLPVVIIGAFVGVWLFYVQHQYEETHWEKAAEWNREVAALEGSSFYDLPQPLMWMTGNIGIHHVHHISSGIPFHVLPKIVRDYPELREIGRLTFWDSIKCVPLALWDEKSRKLISFRQFRKNLATASL